MLRLATTTPAASWTEFANRATETGRAAQSITHRRSRIVAVFGVIGALALIVPTAGAQARNDNPRILPPNSHAYGKTYGAWSAAWWQYVTAQPVSSNPLFDKTGAGCRNGQSGKVFFLVGAGTSESFTRDQCTVPTGKALFFPLVNAVDFEPGFTPLQVWEQLQEFFGGATELHASVDGVPVSNLDPATTPYRVCAGPVSRCDAPSFSLTLPSENLFGAPEGTYEPAVADGYYLLLAPLPPGSHTLTFGGIGLAAGSEFVQDVTYHLVVSHG